MWPRLSVLWSVAGVAVSSLLLSFYKCVLFEMRWFCSRVVLCGLWRLWLRFVFCELVWRVDCGGCGRVSTHAFHLQVRVV